MPQRSKKRLLFPSVTDKLCDQGKLLALSDLGFLCRENAVDPCLTSEGHPEDYVRCWMDCDLQLGTHDESSEHRVDSNLLCALFPQNLALRRHCGRCSAVPYSGSGKGE